MKKLHGFTIIELLITMALVAIVAMAALPNFQNLLDNNRLAGENNDLVASLNYARSEAITRGSTMVVCKSADGASCTTAGDWSQGWIIFNDVSNDQTVDSGEDIVRVMGAFSGDDAMTGSGNSADWISFNRNGFSPQNNGDFIKLCDADASFPPRGLNLNTSGRVEFHKDASVAPLSQACP